MNKLHSKFMQILTLKREYIISSEWNDSAYIHPRQTDMILDRVLFKHVVPIELRRIILKYFGELDGFAEYLIYPKLASMCNLEFPTFTKDILTKVSFDDPNEFTLLMHQHGFIVYTPDNTNANSHLWYMGDTRIVQIYPRLLYQFIKRDKLLVKK
jgi:hypothetical protein